MVFVPALPLTGVSGHRLLQATYDQQLGAFADSSSVQNDRAYLEENLSEPVAVEDFLSDRRLLRITLTSFGLAGEESKAGLVRRVLESVADPDDSLLERLNDSNYEAFAAIFEPDADGNISISAEAIADIGVEFEREAFEEAIGEVDVDQRLGLNYQSDIASLIGTDSSDEAILFRLLGNESTRTLLEGALGLPEELAALPIDRQAEELREQLISKIGVTELSELASPENVEKVIVRFHALQAIANGPSATTPGSVALTLLSGLNDDGIQSLFLSNLTL